MIYEMWPPHLSRWKP